MWKCYESLTLLWLSACLVLPLTLVTPKLKLYLLFITRRHNRGSVLTKRLQGNQNNCFIYCDLETWALFGKIQQLSPNCGWALIARVNEWYNLGQLVYHFTHCARSWCQGHSLEIKGERTRRPVWTLLMGSLGCTDNNSPSHNKPVPST